MSSNAGVTQSRILLHSLKRIQGIFLVLVKYKPDVIFRPGFELQF